MDDDTAAQLALIDKRFHDIQASLARLEKQIKGGSVNDGQRLVGPEYVIERLNITKSYYSRLVAMDSLPKPTVDRGRMVRWYKASIEKWIRDGCPPQRPLRFIRCAFPGCLADPGHSRYCRRHNAKRPDVSPPDDT